MSYTKLAHSILTSTIWVEPDETRIAWFAFLALVDRNGEVLGSIPGLASVARISVEDMRTAIDRFLAPDPDSRTKDHEGRRIEAIPGGWVLLNHGVYRDLDNGDDRRMKAAERQKRFREREKALSNSNSVTALQITPDLPPRCRYGGETPTRGTEQPETNIRHERQDAGNKAKVTPTVRARNPKLSADLQELDKLKLIA